MKLKNIIREDYLNYKKCSLYLAFSQCKLYCEDCFNFGLRDQENIIISAKTIIDWHSSNLFEEAIICSGLNPFDSFEDLEELVRECYKENYSCDLIIFTGYEKKDIEDKIYTLTKIKHSDQKIIIKYGRYDKYQVESIYDDNLGIYLPLNQYSEVIK